MVRADPHPGSTYRNAANPPDVSESAAEPIRITAKRMRDPANKTA